MNFEAFREKMATVGVGVDFKGDIQEIEFDNVPELLEYILDREGFLFVENATLYGNFLEFDSDAQNKLDMFENSLCINYVYDERSKESELLFSTDLVVLKKNLQQNEERKKQLQESIIEGFMLKELFKIVEENDFFSKLSTFVFASHQEEKVSKLKEHIEQAAFEEVNGRLK